MTAPVTPVTLDQIRHEWVHCHRTSDSEPTFTYWTNTNKTPQCITLAALAHLDARLPFLLDYCCRRRTSECICAQVQMTLAMWLTPSILLATGHVAQFIGVTMLPEDKVHVALVEWETLDGIVPHHPIARHMYDTEITLSHAWLEKNHPGSLPRIQLAADLDLTGGLLHDYVFTVPSPYLGDRDASTLPADLTHTFV